MKKKLILFIGIFIISMQNVWAIPASGSSVEGSIDTSGVSTGIEVALPCNPASVSNGSVNTTTCVITCNSGYSKSGNTCVANSGGGGGGGGGGSSTDYCPNGDYSGNFYDSKCEAPSSTGSTNSGSTGGGITSSGVTSSGSTGTGANLPFPDIADSFAVDDIVLLAKNKIIAGYSDGTFRPNDGATRAEFLAMVIKSLGISVDDNATVDFTDIPADGSWMIKYIAKAKELGIANGQEILTGQVIEQIKITDIAHFTMLQLNEKNDIVAILQEILTNEGLYTGEINSIFDKTTSQALNTLIYKKLKIQYSSLNIGPQKLKSLNSITVSKKTGGILVKIFRPNDNVTRAEAIAILLNAAKIPTSEESIVDFTDIPAEGTWMIKYIAKAKELGIANGQIIDGVLKFRPNDSITRAETCRIIIKTLVYLEGIK